MGCHMLRFYALLRFDMLLLSDIMMVSRVLEMFETKCARLVKR